jgi:beta-glucosidase
MSENEELLQGLLRKEWEFQGAIISDFEGVYSTVPSIMAGVALELPGPARFRGKHLLKAIQRRQIPESHIDDLVKDVIMLSDKVGMRDETVTEQDILKNESTANLVRDIAAEGIVLLKNEGHLLPLLPSKKLQIAVFGSPATNPVIHGGGSASLNSSYVIPPLDALKAKFGEANVRYHPGVPIFKKIPSASISMMVAPTTGQPGVDCFWYNDWVVGENPVHHEILETTRTLVIDARIAELQPKHCNRMSFLLRPETTGLHTFGVTSCGKSVLRVDSKVLLEHSGFDDCRVEYVMQPGDFEERADIYMTAGCAYEVTIDTLSTTAPSPSPVFDITPQATSVGFYENLNTPINQKLQQLASESDIAIIFTANNKEYESESFDRSSLSLSPLQDELIRVVAITAPRSILVNQTGSPISMPWIDDVDSILQCWYAGQEVGNALGDIISGDINPSGKLPVTFPLHIEDTPSFGNFPTDQNMRVRYEEGLEMGYRARSKPTPLFPFGYGKSYTDFSLQGMIIKTTPGLSAVDLTVATTVKNTGLVAGREVVQVYVDGVLKGFQKIFLTPGESRVVEVTLDKYAFSEWSPKQGSWIIEPRKYSIELRQDANTVIASTTHGVEISLSWNGV